METVAEYATKVGLRHSASELGWEPRNRKWHVQLHGVDSTFKMRGFLDSWPQAEEEMEKRFEI